MALPISSGMVHFERLQREAYHVLRATWYAEGANWEACERVPFDVSGFLYRFKAVAQGSAGGTGFALYDRFGLDVTTNLTTVNPGTPSESHLTAALSTNRGAMPRVFAGPLTFYGVGNAGDENGVAELWYKPVLDLDESFGAGRCRIIERVHTWTSSSAGAATLCFDDIEYPKLPGVIVAVKTLPDAGAAPTSLYDLTLVDEYGFDIADSLLLNRSSTLAEIVYLWHTAAVAARHQKTLATRQRLELRVANAGKAKSGTVGFMLAVPA